MNYIVRNHYIEKIKPFIGKNLIKVITGQRRVGKSYMLFQLMDEIKKQPGKVNIIYINKEYNEFRSIQNDQDLVNYVDNRSHKAKQNVLMIDEVQEIEAFEKALRHYQAKQNMDIYCTGSNAKMLSGELATFLSGRYIEMKIYSLSYTEFLHFHNLENHSENFQKYIEIGGLPYLVNINPEKQVILDYLKNVYHTILYKDIVSRHNVRNTAFLENLVLYLSNHTGSLISAKRISDYLKSQKIDMTVQLVLNYLNYLEQAFFIYKVKRSEIKGRKIFEVGEKYYFEDPGIRNTICGYQQSHINQLLENIVYLHLRMAGYEVFVGKMGDKEIDFIAEKNNERLYIQVAYLISDENVRDREFGNLLEIKDNFQKMVISADEFTTDYKGCRHLNIRDFLMMVPDL